MLEYLKRRLGERTGIEGLALFIASTVAFAFGKIDYTLYSSAVSGAGMLFFMPQAAMPVQGASAVTDAKTAPVEVAASKN